MVKLPQEDEFFLHGYEIGFEILSPFHIPKRFLKYQTLFSKKTDMHESTTLKRNSRFLNKRQSQRTLEMSFASKRPTAFKISESNF